MNETTSLLLEPKSFSEKIAVEPQPQEFDKARNLNSPDSIPHLPKVKRRPTPTLRQTVREKQALSSSGDGFNDSATCTKQKKT